jgi:K+-transporting ATPase ATPase A chain
MTTAAWLQIAALVGLLLLGTRLLGPYLAKVYAGGGAPGDRVFLPLERLVYRAARVDPEREQPWTVYARSVIAFSLVSVLGLYALQRAGGCRSTRRRSRSVPPCLASSTAVSFVTNTASGRTTAAMTMSHLIQMAGLTVQGTSPRPRSAWPSPWP